MKINPGTINPNLSITSENRPTCASSFKRLLHCSLVWGAVILFAAAIAIAQTTPAPAAQRTDGLIETDVVQAIDNSKSLNSEQITAATIQGEVTLTGNVTSEASRELAETLAARVAGVTHVQNNLKVTSAATPQPAPAIQNQPPADEVAQVEQPQQQTAPAPIQPPPPPADQNQVQPQRPAYTQQQQPAPPNYPNNVPDPDTENLQPYPNSAPHPPSPYGAQNPQQPNPGYGQQYPQQPYPNYGAHAPDPPYDPTPLTVLKGTSIDLRTNQFLDDKRAKEGTTFDLTVIRDVYVANRLAIPRGAIVHGVVVESKSSGQLGGAPSLALKLVSIDLGANNYPLSTDLFKVRGPDKSGHTAGNVVGGTIFGALIGAAIGHGPGAAIGAVAGAATGTAVSAATPGPRAWIPAEALVTFHLQDPVTVVPVTPQEAMRLAQTVMPGNGPTLYRRPPPPGYYYPAGYAPAPGYYYAPGYYAAPMPYYRPYYMVGGYYYWR